MTDQTPEAVEQTAPTTEAPQDGTATEQPDILGQINQRLDQFGQELPNLISQQFEQQQYAYEDPYQQPEQPQEDPYGGLDPNDPRDAALIEARNELQELKQGFQGTQRDMWGRDIAGVLERYPALNPESPDHDPKLSQSVVQSLQRAGHDVNSMINPHQLEMAYKAAMADQYASQQKPLDQAQQQGVSLESSAAQQQEPPRDPAEEIFGKSEQVNPLFNWAVR